MLTGLYEEARRDYAREGMLFDVHLDLLYQCDLDCQHCYLDDKSPQLLPTDFWLGVIDQLAELQVFSMVLSGGEIFLRPDLLEIVAHARALGIFIQLKTHGGHLDDETAAELIRLGVTSVTISYYSTDPGIHDRITRRPGSHQRTLRAIKRLAGSPVHVVATCSVMESNREGVSDVARQMAELGVPVSFDGVIRVAQSGDTFPLDTAVDDEAMVSLALDKGAAHEECSVGESLERWGGQKNCVAGHLSLYIGPEGGVFPCVTWPESLGSLHEESMRSIWERSPALKRIQAQRRIDRPTCRDCELRDDCSYCAGQAFLHKGDPLEPSPVICRATWAQAKAKARSLGLRDPPRPPGLNRPSFPILDSSVTL